MNETVKKAKEIIESISTEIDKQYQGFNEWIGTTKIKFKKLEENAKLPIKGTDDAGAWDVYAASIEKKEDGYYIVSLGFATEIPKGYRVMASGRSSLTKTNWYIPNSPAIIDSDYRGCWQVRFRGVPTGIKEEYIQLGLNSKRISLTYDEFPFEVGDRVAQIYLERVLDIEFEEVLNLEESNRDSAGFGSTGR